MRVCIIEAIVEKLSDERYFARRVCIKSGADLRNGGKF